MSERKGDWIQTASGIAFYPLDPRPEEIMIEDIAHALSHQCRFSGHCRQFYSVAEHSVRVSWIVPPADALWGLLHDAAEAYLVDLPRPIKRYSEMGRLYQSIEKSLMRAICGRFGLSVEQPTSVDLADTVLLVTEKRDLMMPAPKPWEDTAEPLPDMIKPMSSYWAKHEFLATFLNLTAKTLGYETPPQAARSPESGTGESRSAARARSNKTKTVRDNDGTGHHVRVKG